MNRRKNLRSILLALSAIVAVAAGLRFPGAALGQQPPGEAMDRTGILDIRTDDERRVFGDLLCTCGCPRETIATCTCGFANGFRNEAREMMAKGLTQEDIKSEWARRYGPQALAVPTNTGANRLLYLAPLAAIVGMAAVVVMTLRRFRRRDGEKVKAAGAPPVAGAKNDEYDDKLDEELKQLDEE